MAKKLFHLGELVITPGATEALRTAGAHVSTYVYRHRSGDWGDDVPEFDIKANNDSLRRRCNLYSFYKLPDGNDLWIITEPRRNLTTVLIPSER